MCDWHSLNCVWVMCELKSNRIVLVKFIELIQKNRSLYCHERWVDAWILKLELKCFFNYNRRHISNLASNCNDIICGNQARKRQIVKLFESKYLRGWVKCNSCVSCWVRDCVSVCNFTPSWICCAHRYLICLCILSDRVLLICQ